jgi:hypothetical protein
MSTAADQPAMVPSPSLAATVLWIAGITAFTVIYWMMYLPPPNLHDGAHYVVSGVSLVRDHANLNYPYHPHRWGNAYEFWQAGTARFDVRVSYPSQLYSAILGLYAAVAGGMSISSVAVTAFVNCLLGNLFAYLVLRRYASGILLLAAFVATATLSLMVVILSPGNNGIGYAAALFVIWLIVCTPAHPFVIGLALGASSHLRSQLLSLAPLIPFIIVAVAPRRTLPTVFAWVLAGTAITYLGLSFLFSFLAGGSSNAMKFYTDHFGGSLLGLKDASELRIVGDKFIRAMVGLSSSAQLFLFAPLALGLMILSTSRLARTLAATSVVFIMMSVVLYSFDRFAPPQPRYFIVAVPLIALAGVVALRDYVARGASVRAATTAAVLFAALTFGTLYSQAGIHLSRLSIDDVRQRATQLDFPGAAEALSEAFRPDDVVIVNHSLPTGLVYLPKVLYVPRYEQFLNGDNSGIAGIVFAFGDNPPDDFFKPKDWLPTEAIPDIFQDRRGTTFTRTYLRSNAVMAPDGQVVRRSHMVVYRRTSR